MWEEIERSPALAAPGSNNNAGLLANSTVEKIGSEGGKVQVLSDDDANDLCERYKLLAFKIAGEYRNTGVELDDLRSAGLLGLTIASRKYDPTRGVPFGGYAHHWIRGQIRSLFKSNSDLFSLRRRSLTVWHEDQERSHQRDVADESSPAIVLDLSALTERDRRIVEARDRGETLAEIGEGLGISAERVRQREVRARSQIKGSLASRCISDLTQRGKVIRFPVERTRRFTEFRDREPPKHIYREPIRAREIVHHRANAPRLSELRGNVPLRTTRDLGTVIHQWGRP